MDRIQPAVVEQFLDRQTRKSHAGAIQEVERRVWSHRPHHGGCLLHDEPKALLTFAQLALGAAASGALDQQGGNRRHQKSQQHSDRATRMKVIERAFPGAWRRDLPCRRGQLFWNQQQVEVQRHGPRDQSDSAVLHRKVPVLKVGGL